MVTRVLPGGGQDNYPLSVFRREVSGKNPSAVIHTPDTFFVLKKAVSQNGNLFLEYGCAFAHFGQKILKRESEVANDADARSVVQALREIGVRTEMGIACLDYSQLVASVALRVRDFVELKSARYPLFAALVNGIFSNYRDVVSMWQQGAGSARMQFTGGGFGLQGAECRIRGEFPAHFILWKCRIGCRKPWFGCRLRQSRQMEPKHDLLTPVPSAFFNPLHRTGFLRLWWHHSRLPVRGILASANRSANDRVLGPKLVGNVVGIQSDVIHQRCLDISVPH